MALRAGYYGVKRFLRDKLGTIAGTYDETIKSLFPRSEQAVLGAKNLLPNTGVTKSVNNVTFTKNTDGSVTVNTSEASSAVTTYDMTTTLTGLNGKYLLNGVSGGAENTFGIQLQDLTTHVWGETNIEGDTEITLIGNHVYRFCIYVRQGATASNVVIKPMLRLASDPDDTYVPYVMTNKELTDSAADQKTAINAIITAATGAADFAAFKTAMGAITPVTRSLSFTKEDITEEVKEDVEPEKTVTKKRTTKKTEEV